MLNQQLSKALIPTDKTSNMYRLTKEENSKILRDTMTSLQKKTNEIIKKKKKKEKEKEKKSFKAHLTTLLIGWMSQNN